VIGNVSGRSGNLKFGSDVKIRSAFVEDENTPISVQGAGQQNRLPLFAREGGPHVAHK